MKSSRLRRSPCFSANSVVPGFTRRDKIPGAGEGKRRALTVNAPLLPALAASAAIVVLHGLLTAWSARSHWFSRFLKGAATPIVSGGAVDWRRANIGQPTLDEEMRLHGIADIARVDAAHLKRNGKIRVIGSAD